MLIFCGFHFYNIKHLSCIQWLCTDSPHTTGQGNPTHTDPKPPPQGKLPKNSNRYQKLRTAVCNKFSNYTSYQYECIIFYTKICNNTCSLKPVFPLKKNFFNFLYSIFLLKKTKQKKHSIYLLAGGFQCYFFFSLFLNSCTFCDKFLYNVPNKRLQNPVAI